MHRVGTWPKADDSATIYGSAGSGCLLAPSASALGKPLLLGDLAGGKFGFDRWQESRCGSALLRGACLAQAQGIGMQVAQGLIGHLR